MPETVVPSDEDVVAIKELAEQITNSIPEGTKIGIGLFALATALGFGIRGHFPKDERKEVVAGFSRMLDELATNTGLN